MLVHCYDVAAAAVCGDQLNGCKSLSGGRLACGRGVQNCQCKVTRACSRPAHTMSAVKVTVHLTCNNSSSRV